MKSRVLVTGANGQLGKTFRDLSDNFIEAIEFVFVEKSKLDITNPSDLMLFFKENKFDYCVNCAAYTQVDLAESETEKAMDINGHAVENLAIICDTYEIVLIHLSTDYVFDGESSNPYQEDDQTNPINIYGKSKLLGEENIKKHLNNYFIIRTSWLYSKFNKNFVKTVYNKIKADEQLSIIASQKGTPTSCNDISNFIIFLIINKISDFGVYHFSAEGETTWYGLGLHISHHFNSSSNVTPTEVFKSKANRPTYSVLSNKKVISLTKQAPNNWQDSVDKVLKSLAND